MSLRLGDVAPNFTAKTIKLIAAPRHILLRSKHIPQ